VRDLEVARERLRLAEKQRGSRPTRPHRPRSFDAGVVSSLDVIDANDRLYLAEVGLAEARARLAAARIAIARALGEDDAPGAADGAAGRRRRILPAREPRREAMPAPPGYREIERQEHGRLFGMMVGARLLLLPCWPGSSSGWPGSSRLRGGRSCSARPACSSPSSSCRRRCGTGGAA